MDNAFKFVQFRVFKAADVMPFVNKTEKLTHFPIKILAQLIVHRGKTVIPENKAVDAIGQKRTVKSFRMFGTADDFIPLLKGGQAVAPVGIIRNQRI